jgi:hypothetical protein
VRVVKQWTMSEVPLDLGRVLATSWHRDIARTDMSWGEECVDQFVNPYSLCSTTDAAMNTNIAVFSHG